MLCELATEQAGQAAAAAERSRGLLARAAHEIERLEDENARLQRQVHTAHTTDTLYNLDFTIYNF